MNKQRGPFTVIQSRQIYRNPWISLREDQVIRPEGGNGIFGVIEMKPGSTVLPITPDGEIFLVQEYKYAVDRPSTELISGGIESAEKPLEAAKRELLEEVGIISNEWHSLGVVDPFTTVVSSPNHMFLALNAELQVGATSEIGHRLVRWTFEDAIGQVIAGTITHAASCVLLLKAALFIRQVGTATVKAHLSRALQEIDWRSIGASEPRPPDSSHGDMSVS